jgi:hypothetical protein
MYDATERQEIIKNLIQLYRKEQDEKKIYADKIREKNKEKGIVGGGTPKYPPKFSDVLRSIYDGEKANSLAWDILGESGFKKLFEQIIDEKPDIVFLIVRSAVPAGIVYKSYLREMKIKLEQEKQNDLLEAYKKIPVPKFLLADVKIINNYGKRLSGSSLSFNEAVRIYEKKLHNYLEQQKDNNSPVQIRVFDESKSTGYGLQNQTNAVADAAHNIGLNADVEAFDYPTFYYGRFPVSEPPKIPLAISFIPKSGDALPLIKNEKEKSYELISGGTHSKWKHLYEGQSMRLAKMAGKFALEFDMEDSKGSLRKLMEKRRLI